MNTLSLSLNHFKAIFAATLLALSLNVLAQDKDCWADFFEGSQYGGKHFLVEGSSQFENLAKVDGENWDKRIHSIKVGAKAKVTAYQNPRFELTLTEMAKKPDFMAAWGVTEQDIKEDSELIFTGEASVHDLGDFNFHRKIRSLKVDCID